MTQDDSPGPGADLNTLIRRIERIEARLSRLERDSVMPSPREEVSPAAAPAEDHPAPATVPDRAAPPGGIVALLGRSLLILGGGFLLRAITESEYLPPSGGTATGIAYAILWLFVGDRTAGRGMRHAATFYGITAGLIVYPLLWETTSRFGTLPVPLSALATAAITGGALLVARRHGLRALAWLTSAGAAATAVALGFATARLLPFLLTLLALGWITLGLGFSRGWHLLSWSFALFVDFMLMLVVSLLLLGSASPAIEAVPEGPLVVPLLSLVVIYLGTIAGRALWGGARLGLMDVFLAFAAFLVGFGGALAVSGHAELDTRPLGGVSLVMAAGSYAVSFAFVDRRRQQRRNFIVFTTFALLFAVVAFAVLLSGSSRALALAAVSLVTFILGSRFRRATLSLHGAMYATAAAMQGGLLAAGLVAFLGSAPSTQAWSRPEVLIVLAVAAVCCALPVATHGKTWGSGSRLPKLLVLVLTTLGLGGWAVAAGASLLPRDPAEGVDVGLLASLRTGVLALSALLLTLAARWPRVAEARWLVPPVLVVLGLKLLLEDFRVGRAWTLFLSLALYGGALILTPRLRRPFAALEPRARARDAPGSAE